MWTWLKDPIVISVVASVASYAWGWFRGKNPKLETAIRTWQPRIRTAAYEAFRVVELLGAANGWDGTAKNAMFKARVHAFLRDHGVPLPASTVDGWLDAWAEAWAVEAKLPDDPVGQARHALQDALQGFHIKE